MSTRYKVLSVSPETRDLIGQVISDALSEKCADAEPPFDIFDSREIDDVAAKVMGAIVDAPILAYRSDNALPVDADGALQVIDNLASELNRDDDEDDRVAQLTVAVSLLKQTFDAGNGAIESLTEVAATYKAWDDTHHGPLLESADVTLAQAIEGAFNRMDLRIDALTPQVEPHKAYICVVCGKQVDDLNMEVLQQRSGRRTCCPDREFVPWDDPKADRMRRIDAAHRQLDAVEKTWATLFASEAVGQTRTYFADVLENIRNARRTR